MSETGKCHAAICILDADTDPVMSFGIRRKEDRNFPQDLNQIHLSQSGGDNAPSKWPMYLAATALSLWADLPQGGGEMLLAVRLGG